MPRIHFSTTIEADRRTVWETMLERDTYRQWTAAFTEGSDYEGSWDEGARIRFLGPDGSGMSAVIAENRPHEFLSIKHLGMIANGVEDTESESVRAWAPAFENYTFTEADGRTELRIDMDVAPDFEQTMNELWPKALVQLKAIAEARASR